MANTSIPWAPSPNIFSVEQNRNGAIILHLVFMAYMSYTGAAVCYYFFLPAIDIITKKLKIKQDVAGAIFIAACVSLPDMILNLIEVFLESDGYYPLRYTSFGSLIGSAIFNILILIGAGCFAVRQPLRLKKWPVFRDLFFYIISILLLFTFVLVGDSPLIYWYQALLPVCWYGIYLLTLAFDDKIGQKLKTCLKTQQEPPSINDEEETEANPIDMTFHKGNILKMILYITIFPVFLTLPDVGNKEYTILPSFKIPGHKLFVWTFVGSIIWIYLLSMGIVWLSQAVGETLGIPPEVTGVTFVAIGVGMPFIIITILLVRKGKGNMTVSTSFGYNIFKITVGFPLPWLIWTLVQGEPIFLYSTAPVCLLVLLLIILVGFMVSLLISRFNLRPLLGAILIILYIVFVIIFTVLEYGYIRCPI